MKCDSQYCNGCDELLSLALLLLIYFVTGSINPDRDCRIRIKCFPLAELKSAAEPNGGDLLREVAMFLLLIFVSGL